MNSYKKLIGNSFIFGIGSIGSKLISIILVPLYTYYLSTSEYGTVDLITVTVTMLLPIVSASVFEAVLRFIMDKDKSTEVVLTNSIFIASIGFFVALILFPILNYVDLFGEHLIYMYLILFVQIYERIFAQYTRAVGKIKIFALNGIIQTLTTGLLNILFLAYLGLGIQGYFWAMILSSSVSILFINLTTKAYKKIQLNKVSNGVSKELLSYSIPMIPNTLMWWLINASSRYFIFFFVGVNANGLFAVASKIPSIINLINQVFTQAWQLSAIEEYENKNKSVFYSNVFGYLSSLMFLGTSAVIVIVKFLFESLFAADYFVAWRVVPFLLLGAVFSCFSGFLGTNYIAAKQTKGVFKTSIYGGISSLILNIIFIPTLGVIGAGVSSMVSFFIMFIIRYFDTKQYIEMYINWKLFIINLIIISVQIAVLTISFPIWVELVLELTLFVVLLLFNHNLLKPVLKIFNSAKEKFISNKKLK